MSSVSYLYKIWRKKEGILFHSIHAYFGGKKKKNSVDLTNKGNNFVNKTLKLALAIIKHQLMTIVTKTYRTVIMQLVTCMPHQHSH